MEAINMRLKQLEDAETHMYSEREATIHLRCREDAELLSKRQSEDEDYLRALGSRDHEEDVSVMIYSFGRR